MSPDQTRKRLELLKSIRWLKAKVREYELHCEQYEVQRPRIRAMIEALQPGEAAVYRDFVNDHCEAGAKVCNMVLVIIDRPVEGGASEKGTCIILRRSNHATHFLTWMLEFHLHPADDHHSGLLAGYGVIYLFGDHGPHFSAAASMYKEAEFCRRFDTRILVDFLCSYHAYNPADGAGVVYKRLSAKRCKEGAGPRTELEFSQMINSANYDNHIAFRFPDINRGSDLVPPLGEVEGMSLRKMCQVRYEYKEDGVLKKCLPGELLSRLVSEKGPFTVHDLMKERKGTPPMCKCCSQTTQRPVRHEGRCPIGEAEAAIPLLDRGNSVLPDPARIRGPQAGKKKVN